MSIFSGLKGFILYKEPVPADQFRFPETEPEDVGEALISPAVKWQVDAESAAAEGASPEALDTATTPELEAEARAGHAQKEAMPNLSRRLNVNLDNVRSIFAVPANQDVVIREFTVLEQKKAFLVYVDGMADKEVVNNFVLRQLMERAAERSPRRGNAIQFVAENLLSVNQLKRSDRFSEIAHQVMNGLTALFIDGCAECLLVESRGYEKRAISTPMNEAVIKGSQEAFNENLRTNITLVRRMIRNRKLITEIVTIGKVDNTNCAILYLDGIANPKLVAEVKRRLENVDIDFVGGDGMMDQLIEDHPYALFPQVLSTERPDRTASFLVEGKVAIITDGTPFASIVPATFFHLFHTFEDNALRWQYGTFIRFVRLLASIFATFLPGLFVALILYHQEMVPTELMASVSKAREAVPFPMIVEVLLMETSWELIREASVRVPGVVGQTLGIIGAVILGQAAVAANLVSPILIIVVAITGMGNFAIPNFSLSFAVRILRFGFIFLGGIAGFYGIATGIFIFGLLVCSMKSFGVPYLSPVAPRTKSNLDIIARTPIWLQKARPDFVNPVHRARTNRFIRGWNVKHRGANKP